MIIINRENMKAKLKCLKGPLLTDSTESILTVVEAQLLTANYKIPYYNHERDTGYQREPSKGRIKALAKKLYESDTDLPTLVVANIRKLEALNHYDGDVFSYNPDLHGKLFIADGQHRIEALKAAIEMAKENADTVNEKRLREKLIPVLITFTSQTDLIEMKTFYSINKHGKNVPINDAAMILHRRYKLGDKEIMDEMDQAGEQWRIVAGDVAANLNKNCSVWKNRIKSPGQRVPAPNITFAAMVNHLKPLVKSPDLEGKGIKIISNVACAYWEGISLAHPQLFDNETAKLYAIQTSSATEVINKIWDHVRAKIQASNLKSKDLTDPQAYKSIMEQLIVNCDGRNGMNSDVSSSDYWLKGKAGCAGMYTSNSAKATFSNYLKGLLSDIQI